MSAYTKMKKRHLIEFNAFPISFAFSKEQFVKGMIKLGLNPAETDKVCRLSGTGGFFRKSDAVVYEEMSARHEREMRGAIEADKTGDGFIFDMFDYELGNHEYTVTYDVEDTLAALGLSQEIVAADPRLAYGLEKARKRQFSEF